MTPTAGVIVAFTVIRRAANFAVTRPTREVLFTLDPREGKYKAKGFIDTFVYRFGDQVGAWSFSLMGAVGLGVAGTAWVALPLSAASVGVGWWIGRTHQRAADRAETALAGAGADETAVAERRPAG